MAIAEKKYKELKPYWDFQRKLEYNRELLKKQVVNVQTKYNFHHPEMSPDDMFTLLWDKITQNDLETPPKTWVPENDEFKLWNELKQLPKSTGRPVVLRARQSNEDSNI